MPKPKQPPTEENLARWQAEARQLSAVDLPPGEALEVAYGWAVPYTTWRKHTPPPAKWLIPQWLPAGSIVLLSGHSKYTMKTTTALCMAFAIACKRPFSGELPPAPQNVLYVLEEGAWNDTYGRLEAIRNTLNIGEDEATNLYIAFRNGVKLNDPNRFWVTKIKETIQEKKIVCLFIDTFTYAKLGDENAVKDMLPCAQTIQEIQTLGCTVVILTHLRKGTKTRGEDPSEQIRGSSVLRDIFDFHLALRAYGRSKGTITLDVIDRWGAPRPTYRVEWQIDTDDRGKLRSCKPMISEKT
jgi:RecA-family ATPase